MRPIDVLRMSGALAAVVPAGSYSDNQQSPTDADCTITFNTNGSWSCTGDSGGSGIWKTGGGTGANYWIKWTNTSGTLSSGTAGTWQQISTNPAFGVVFTGINGSKSCTGTVQIATDAAGVNVIDSGSITITATVTP